MVPSPGGGEEKSLFAYAPDLNVKFAMNNI